MRFTDTSQLCDALGLPFSDEQLTAITAPLEPGVIIAGAGTGKTTVMAARVVWLVGTGAVRPDEVLGLTFTRKAAGELAQRVRASLLRSGTIDAEALEVGGEEVIMTYDAFAGYLVRQFGALLGLDTTPALIAGAARFRLAETVLRQVSELGTLARFALPTLMSRLLNLDGELQSNLVSSADVLAHTERFIADLDAAPLNRLKKPFADVVRAAERARERAELATLVTSYQEIKRSRGLTEFGDQLRTAIDLVTTVPSVAETVRDTWRVVLLDEYQDTSAAQCELLTRLFDDGHAVTAVGDPCQAIYGWRGAAANNITGFAETFRRRDASTATAYQLTENRRSGTRILDVANDLAKPLRDDPFVSGSVHELTAPDETPPGEIVAVWWPTWPQEAEWIADTVVAAHPSGGGSIVAQWSDVAVLCRRNRELGELFDTLRARDIPVEIVGLSGLLSVPEVAEVVSVLRVVADESANEPLVEVLSGRRWGIGPRDLAMLAERARQLSAASQGSDAGRDSAAVADEAGDLLGAVRPTSLWSAVIDPGIEVSDDARNRLVRFVREMNRLRANRTRPVAELVADVVHAMSAEVEARTHLATATQSGDEQLVAFRDAVGEFADVEPQADLAGLLAWLAAEADYGVGLERAVPNERDSVKLLTVHRAKGLEWDLVLCPALVSKTFPSDRSTANWTARADIVPADLRGDADGIVQLAAATKEGLTAYAEDLKVQHRRSEDRLAYVAATRAKKRLVASGHRWRTTRATACEPSDYFTVIAAHADKHGGFTWNDSDAAENPLTGAVVTAQWPVVRDALDRHRLAAAAMDEPPPLDTLPLDERDVAAAWHDEVTAQLEQWQAARARHDRRTAQLPTTLSTSSLMRARNDPAAFAEQLIRPMPVRPYRRAELGTRLHEWVERHLADNQLFIPDDELVSADDVDDADLRELTDAFRVGQFEARQPYAVEQPVSLLVTVDGVAQVLNGRIDAVYTEPDGGWLLVDWKTHADPRSHADALQLGCYRLAWAQARGVEVEMVRAGFYYVRRDQLVTPDDLPTHKELIRLLSDVTASRDLA